MKPYLIQFGDVCSMKMIDGTTLVFWMIKDMSSERSVGNHSTYSSRASHQTSGKIMRILAAILFALPLLFGCATTPTSPPPESKTQTPPPPPSTPKELGKAFLVEALKSFRFVKDPEITGLVNEVGRNIVRAAGSNPNAYHFFVVRESQLNAFAIPGGYVFLFQGLLAQLEGVEELAGVLAHEVAHVEKNHFFKDIRKVQALELATIAAILLGGPEAAVMAQAASINLQLQYSRENEEEADAAALTYLERAGYDPRGLQGFFEKLATYENYNPPLLPSYFSTHPGVRERLQTVSVLLRAAKGEEGNHRVMDEKDWMRTEVILRATLQGPQRTDEDITRMVSQVMGKEKSESEQHYLLGLAFLKADRIMQAIPEYVEAVSLNPDNAVYHAELAFCYMRSLKLDLARAEAEKGLTLSSDKSALAYLVLGIVQGEEGKLDNAVWNYEQALANAPSDLRTHWNLAQTYLKKQDDLMSAYHLGEYARLNLQPNLALNQFKRAQELAGKTSEMGLRIEEEIQEIQQEGI